MHDFKRGMAQPHTEAAHCSGEEQARTGELLDSRISRRRLLSLGAKIGLTAPAFASLLAACSDDGGSEDDATADQSSDESESGGSESDEDPEQSDDSEESTGGEDESSEWRAVIHHQTGGADPLSEYPTLAQYYLPWHVMEPLFHPALADDGQSWTLVNELAKSWEFTDPQTLVVELEQGVMFHNGEELTAEHVKAAYDAIMAEEENPTRRKAPLRPLGEAEIVDDYTIQWNMPEPDISVLGALYQLLVPPMARHDMTAEEFEQAPIGTGPYQVVSWPRNGTVELEAWDDYRHGKATPSRLVIEEVPDPSTRAFELISGNADVASGLAIDSLADLENEDSLQAVSLQGPSNVANVINVFKTDPPLNDPRVRQAMNYAIDREAITESITEGRALPHPGPLAPGWMGYDQEFEPYPYDPERARELLAEAGAEGITVNWMLTPGANLKNVETAQAVASQMSEVGITLNVEPVETARLLSDRSAGDYDIVQLTFGITWMPTTLFQFTMYESWPEEELEAEWGETPDVVTDVRNLYGEASDTTDLDEMSNSLGDVHQLMHDQACWLYVATTDELYGVRQGTGYRPFPCVYFRFYDEWSRRGMTPPDSTTVPLIQG